MLISIWQRSTMWIGLAALLACSSQLAADEPNAAPIVDAQDYEATFDMRDEDAAEFLLTQTQPPDVAAAQPEEPTTTPAPTRQRRRTYRSPPMFGDIFGGGTYQLTIQPQPTVIANTLVDGVNAGFFVTNMNGGNGADINPAVGIQVFDRGSGALIASSVGPGINFSGNNQPDTYPIDEPQIPGVSPPALPGPGVIAFDGGNAVFVNGILTTPLVAADGSVNEANGWGIEYSHTFTPAATHLNIPTGGGAVGREKMAENNSPDTDARLYWSYSFYNDVFGGIGDVNRNSLGIEQPVWDGMASVAIRFPFAGTLDVDQVAGATTARNTQFGDVTLIGKVILWREDGFVLSSGLGLTVPTANNSRVFTTTGTRILELHHQSVHLLPFLAMLRASECGWYWQSFLQLDIAANGDPVDFDIAGANLNRVGVLQDQTLLLADIGVGYWLVGGPGDESPGIAATAELHYTTALQQADAIRLGALNLTSSLNRFDALNFTTGLNIAINDRMNIRPAFVIPLADDIFDYEAMVQANLWR
jgi:hypothetical protein